MSELLKEKKNLTGGDDIGSSRGKVGGLFSVETQQQVLKWLLSSSLSADFKSAIENGIQKHKSLFTKNFYAKPKMEINQPGSIKDMKA